jgi:hypothetical protein
MAKPGQVGVVDLKFEPMIFNGSFGWLICLGFSLAIQIERGWRSVVFFCHSPVELFSLIDALSRAVIRPDNSYKASSADASSK